MNGTSGVNAVRLADTALKNACSVAAFLRLTGVAASGDADQLGLSSPQYQDAPLGPAVWRKVGVNTALLVGASAMSALAGTNDLLAAEAMLEAAVGVVVEGVLYTISNCEAIVSGGEPCAYRLTLVAPVRF